MNARNQVLISDIAADEGQIRQIYQKLAESIEKGDAPDQSIVIGYYLHNLYTAFEHICTLVAAAFENQITDREQWHALLLRRMTQDIPGIRPRLFRDASYDCLEELRRFRHVFRSAYSITLDPARLALVLHKAQELKEIYQADLDKFKEFLSTV